VKALFLCVHYHSPSALREMLGSLRACEDGGVDLEVIVVDNSDPGRRLNEATVLHWAGNVSARLAIPERNLGYYGGAAWALADYLERRELPEWVIVSNADLTYSRDFLPRLRQITDDVAVVAPRIKHADSGADENPFMVRAMSPRKVVFYCWLFRHPGLFVGYEWLARSVRRVRSFLLLRSRAVAEPRQIYAPHGACVGYAKQYFARGGTLKHPLFLYGEEFFVGETARILGLKVSYQPELLVTHQHGVATGALQKGRRAAYLLEAMLFYRRISAGSQLP
jgi:GT2 family glycosyltransferase